MLAQMLCEIMIKQLKTQTKPQRTNTLANPAKFCDIKIKMSSSETEKLRNKYRQKKANGSFENPQEKTRTQKIVRSLFNFAEKMLNKQASA